MGKLVISSPLPHQPMPYWAADPVSSRLSDPPASPALLQLPPHQPGSPAKYGPTLLPVGWDRREQWEGSGQFILS